MKRSKHRLPIPQHEFGFTPDTFNLIQDTAEDCERIARERAESHETRHIAAGAQSRMFTAKEPHLWPT